MICDTSGIFSALSADQPHHEECSRVLRESNDRLLPPLVFAEVDYLAGRLLGQERAAKIMKLLAGPEYEILPMTSEIMATAADVMTTFSDINLGVVDASLIAHSKQSGTNNILTLDQSHFRVVRALDGRPFRLLPFDEA